MKKKIALVTGCAGFIGSNLIHHLLKKKFFVIGVDNFRTGRIEFIKKYLKNKNFIFEKKNLIKDIDLKKIFKNKIDIVFHMAANADVRNGYLNPLNDLKFNTIMTSKILEFVRIKKIKEFVFCSTGSIYGESKSFPTPENDKFPVQTSMYGASKLACEGLIQAYSEAYNIKSYIFRFVSILGNHYTHGHIYDFCKQLFKNSKHLKVLGDGGQTKSYLNINDCINAILLAIKKSKNKTNIYNLGTNEYINVKQSIKIICEELKVKPKISFSGGKRGWIGDSPFIFLDTKKIRALGWKPKFTIKESVEQTTKYLKDNKWFFKKRK
ncbi:MAG: NAD-dependent epimerase/dehydratase family protein [Candidatus Pelagibacter sp.]